MVLDEEVFRQVQDLWARSSPVYGGLRDVYRNLLNLDSAQLPSGADS
jgi:hypothetical protein